MTPPAHHSAAAARDTTSVVARAAEVIAVPKAAPANSFVLHAPLELMARVGLLRHLPDGHLDEGLARIEWLTDEYLAAGDPVDDPSPLRDGDDVARLLDALDAGDLDEVDRLAAGLLPAVSPYEANGLLGEATVTSLAAAGHAPIGFFLLGREWPALPCTLLRGALRGIATRPDWQVGWQHDVTAEGDPAGLYEAVRSTPRLGRPGSDFIFPLMSQVQDSGLARDLLAPLLTDHYDVPAASRTLARTAAWSMVHDDPSQAPYGWTHMLTMTQAVMALAGGGVHPRTALAVAGTFAVGFRAAHGTVDLPERIEPPAAPDVTIGELALAASRHEDAHLVKYTLACLHAAAADPWYRTLHLAAAAHLVEWWSAHDAAA